MIEGEDDGCVSTKNPLVADFGKAGEANRLCPRADINPIANFWDSEHAASLADAALMTNYHRSTGNRFRLWRALSRQIHPATKFRGCFRCCKLLSSREPKPGGGGDHKSGIRRQSFGNSEEVHSFCLSFLYLTAFIAPYC